MKKNSKYQNNAGKQNVRNSQKGQNKAKNCGNKQGPENCGR